jgi:hypothetical protein
LLLFHLASLKEDLGNLTEQDKAQNNSSAA